MRRRTVANQQLLDDYKHKQNQQRKAFKECFTSPAGKEVLQALREEFYDIDLMPNDQLQFQSGQRDVLWQILTKAEMI